VNVTGRYAQAVEKVAEEMVPVHVRVFDKLGGERMVVGVRKSSRVRRRRQRRRRRLRSNRRPTASSLV